MIPVLLDTDIGTDVDDAIALALLLASPELELRALTTVSGDAALRGRIARKLLALTGRDDVQVAAGIREPLLRQRSFLWMGHEGSRIVENGEPLVLSPMHGVDLLIETVLRERPHVLAIGPLTNLAVAIIKEPAVIEAIPHLTVMGGSFGQAPVPMVDYNLGSDPEASLVVLNSPIPTTLVPVDVTCQVRLAGAGLARLRACQSRIVQVLCDAMELWWPLHQAMSGGEAYPRDAVAFLHDPLTVACVFERSFLTFREETVTAVIDDGVLLLRRDKEGRRVEVAGQVDAAAFVEFVIERLERLR